MNLPASARSWCHGEHGKLSTDVILVGGGLSNGLLAHRLHTRRPELRVLVLEQDALPGGSHTWSFHEGDLTEAQNGWISPFVAHDWPGYQVRFPGLRRRMGLRYRSVTAERFRSVLAASLGERMRTGITVTDVRADGVTLASGEVLAAAAVLDGRGFRPSPHVVSRFQTFLGQEVRLAAPHGLSEPILMDATVPQQGAYRFVYVLPFAPDVLLIEDTYYADTPALDLPAVRERIADYASQQGWQIQAVLREESGTLPVTLSGDVAAFWREPAAGSPASGVPYGVRAGLYHPTTGYSLPDAVRMCDRIAAEPALTSASLRALVERHATSQWRRQWMFRLLNRMLFLAGAADQRYVVMRRFYHLSEQLISRFYAGSLKPRDDLRLLAGRPPVPLGGALHAMMATGR